MGGQGSGSRRPDTVAVHPGADDNASSDAVVLQLAKHFKKVGSKRSIIFMFFGAEEQGLIGSKNFIEWMKHDDSQRKNLPINIKGIVAMVNLDMVGRMRDNALSVSGTGTSSGFKALAEQVAEQTNLHISCTPDGYGPSDQASFVAADIPVLYLTTGGHMEYHTPADKPATLNYEGMQQTLEYAQELITLDALAKKLRAQRFKNGSVKFDREEMRFDIDEKGKPTRVYFKRSKDANKLIEEFMLIANKTVAESVGKVPKGKKAKTLPYRVHDDPDPIRMEQLKQFVTHFGYRMKSTSTRGATARAINTLMDECDGKAENNAIQMVALKAMMKAKYSTHNIGHFGLAFDYYTHFTSPIRRYPDTMVHRLLTRYEEGGKSANQKYYEELCEHSSQMEQIAASAERDSIKYKMVEFMGEHIGEEFDAHISGITSYGIYAEIDENHCEGMILIRDLKDDYYEFDEKNFCLIGRRFHNRYQLGDPVRIRVSKANLEKKQLDFTLVE
jgi:exoribonuclease II